MSLASTPCAGESHVVPYYERTHIKRSPGSLTAVISEDSTGPRADDSVMIIRGIIIQRGFGPPRRKLVEDHRETLVRREQEGVKDVVWVQDLATTWLQLDVQLIVGNFHHQYLGTASTTAADHCSPSRNIYALHR